MNAVIWGTDAQSVVLKNLLEKFPKTSRLNISAFIPLGSDNRSIISGKPVAILEAMLDWYHSGEIQKIIMSRDNVVGQSSIVPFFVANGISLEDFWISQRINWNLFLEDRIDNLLEPYCDASYLPYLEFHIADQCNLNCKACEHYSGLVRGEVFPNFAQWSRDFDLLKTLIEDIGMIRILGGEPLLNPEIVLYMQKARQNYPLSQIRVVTNAIKLRSMPEDFFEACRNLNITIWISFYPPMKNQMPAIQQFLDARKINYTVSPYTEQFEMKQTLKPHNDALGQFWRCFQSRCNNFYDGKIAACFLPFTTKYFNEYFAQDLPEDGAIDLHESGLTTRVLKQRLLSPFERCRFCASEIKVPWQQIKHPSTLDDWIRK